MIAYAGLDLWAQTAVWQESNVDTGQTFFGIKAYFTESNLSYSLKRLYNAVASLVKPYLRTWGLRLKGQYGNLIQLS